MENETIQLLLSVMAGGLTIPLAAYIKAKLPTDFPIQSVVIASGLNLLMVWLIGMAVAPELTFVQLIPYALGAQVTSQLGHSIKKTTNGGGA